MVGAIPIGRQTEAGQAGQGWSRQQAQPIMPAPRWHSVQRTRCCRRDRRPYAGEGSAGETGQADPEAKAKEVKPEIGKPTAKPAAVAKPASAETSRRGVVHSGHACRRLGGYE